MQNNLSLEQGFNHAWRYFEIHAQQRITVFNFFLAISGLVCAGIGVGLQQGDRFSFLTSILGIFLTFVSFVFWKLDQRVCVMIKRAEKAISSMEASFIHPTATLFSKDLTSSEQETQEGSFWTKTWTYGRCFRVAFFAVGLAGIICSTLPFLT